MATEAPVKEVAALSINDSDKPATNGSAASPAPASNGSNGSNEGSGNFKEQFKAFSKFGDVKSDGKFITLSQSDKWMKQAHVIDKKITTTDTGIHFKKLKAMKVSVIDYQKFLEDLAKTKGVELTEIKNKMANCGAPGATTKVSVMKPFIFYLKIFHYKILYFSRMQRQQKLWRD
jgi:hypothetical protein